MRGATPGTLLALVAVILLALVTLSTPIIKSIAFLNITIENQNGSFGTLGYCLSGTCHGPTLGYSFDPNQLLGIRLVSSKISSSVIKGLTYTLVLHPVALGAAAATVLLGILAHCDGCLAPCFSTCFAGITASLTAIAFGLDLALFVLAKKRIEAVGNGESATYGTALWMTLAAWIIMIVAACAFGCSCLGGGGGGRKKRTKDEYETGAGGGYGNRNGKDGYAEQMRMDALAAEQDRKRRQEAYGRNGGGRVESDLPKFAEYETEHEVAVPLTSNYDDGSNAYHGNGYQPYHQQHNLYGAGANPICHQQNVVPPLRQPSSATANHVAGVGNGYGNGRRANSNQAGQGAHAGAAAATALYTPGNGPQPYRDPPASNLSHSQQYHEYGTAIGGGHQAEYSGQTFGGGGNDLDYERRAASVAPSVQSGVGGAYRAPSTSNHHHQQYSSYDPYSQQQQQQRPSVPDINSTPYGNRAPSTAPAEVPLSPRREPTVDDGFGLAVLTAGAAAAAKQRSAADTHINSHDNPLSPTEDDYRYGNQASSAYGHGYSNNDHQDQSQQMNPTQQRQQLPSIPTHQEQNYFDDSLQVAAESSHNHSSNPPPEYDWDNGENSQSNNNATYGQTPFTRSSYPVEKR